MAKDFGDNFTKVITLSTLRDIASAERTRAIGSYGDILSAARQRVSANTFFRHRSLHRCGSQRNNSFMTCSYFLFPKLFGLGLIRVPTLLFAREYLLMPYSLIPFYNCVIVNLIKINLYKHRVYKPTTAIQLQSSNVWLPRVSKVN